MEISGDISDKVLIEGLVKGDEASFKTLFDLYKDKVFNTSIGFLANESDAEDIAQEVFIEVFRSIKSFEGKSKLSTWIYRITVTKSLDLIRRKNRKKRAALFTSFFGTGDELKNEPADFFHPGVELENKELSSILFKAIDKIPEHQKTAFILHKIEGLSYQEICEVMGNSVPAVESLIHRAKTNLRKILKNYYEK